MFHKMAFKMAADIVHKMADKMAAKTARAKGVKGTYGNAILHVSEGTGELSEVQFRREWHRVRQVP